MQQPSYRPLILLVLLAVTRFAVAQEHIVIQEKVAGQAEVTASGSITLKPGFHAVAGSQFHAYISAEGNAGSPVYQTPVVAESTQPTVPVSGQNYIRTIAPREPLTSLPTGAYKHSETIAYFDGLGRPSQTVAVAASPNRTDLVTPVVYDAFGREAAKYLPYAAANANGQFRSGAVDECIGFYSQQVTGQVRDSRPFTFTEYDNSPLNRVVAQTGPGQEWHANKKSTAYKYTTNSVPIQSWDETGAAFQYPASSLYVTEVTDEDCNPTREYKDKLGQVVRKESFDGTAWLATIYVYDDFGLLRTVVPPKAASPADGELCYFYTYDGRKRMVTKKIPGAEVVYMVYDKRDRLVLSQDGNLRAQGKYLFTKYDQLNRPVLTGTIAIPASVADIRTAFANTDYTLYETYEGVGKPFGYTLNNSFPQSFRTVTANDILTVTWYDNYDYLNHLGYEGYGYAAYPIPNGFAAERSTKIKGMVTGTLVMALGGDAAGKPIADGQLLTVPYYDDYGNAIRTIADNHKGGKEITSQRFAPVTHEVMASVSTQKVPGQPDLTLARTFSYDHAGRPLEATLQVNGGNTVVESAMGYNQTGQLTAKYLHSPDAGGTEKTFVQKIDYTYNVRGWLTQINDPDEMGGDAFAMKLMYNKLEGVSGAAATGGARYNGNIAAVQWNTAGDKLRGYGFAYDGLNRLKASYYGEGSGLGANVGAFNEHIGQYDANGNIVKLQRYYNGTMADNLSYTYELNDKSNRLQRVADPAGDAPGVADYALQNGLSYAYDANGNMTTDPGKGTTIGYNYLNLPQTVTFATGEKLFYRYDAAGRKLAQTLETNTSNNDKYTEYVGGTIYVNGQPVTVGTPEGRLVPDGSGGWRHEYFLKDHLGNTRAVVAGTLLPGTADVLQTTSYYPFGLAMAQTDYNTLLANYHENRYLYNGKELQTEGPEGVELGWYDYGARMYDAALGRWHVVDPLAEKYFEFGPYHYVRNNPIKLIDPTGMSDQDPNGPPEENKKLKREAEARKKEQEEWEKWRRENLLKDAEYNAIDEFDYQRRVNDAVQGAAGGGGVAFMQVEVRAGVSLGELGITSSVAYGIMLDRQGNIATYSVPSFGACNGFGLFTGVSGGLFPKAKSIYEITEWGVGAGFTYSFGGKSFALEGDAALGKNDFRLGGTMGTPISWGFGAMGYVDVSYLQIHKSWNISNLSLHGLSEALNSTIPNSSYTPADAALIFQYLYNLLP